MPLSDESNSFVQSVTALLAVGTLLGGIAGFRTIRANRSFASRAASDYTAATKTGEGRGARASQAGGDGEPAGRHAPRAADDVSDRR
ncbi:hypothetical protein FNF28_02660 [Cafeteria roenbergensis]|uniref:Uncharacterized protein n=1 Tax=Cafeteria roenbergensis TaxID=33653 RepID=A0A5A8DTA3_CAFRO|nr:hypothetical protein FNF28_02660 [Cafeteria roenbergensis]